MQSESECFSWDLKFNYAINWKINYNWKQSCVKLNGLLFF